MIATIVVSVTMVRVSVKPMNGPVYLVSSKCALMNAVIMVCVLLKVFANVIKDIKNLIVLQTYAQLIKMEQFAQDMVNVNKIPNVVDVIKIGKEILVIFKHVKTIAMVMVFVNLVYVIAKWVFQVLFVM
jgi:hypothetical protein